MEIDLFLYNLYELFENVKYIKLFLLPLKIKKTNKLLNESFIQYLLQSSFLQAKLSNKLLSLYSKTCTLETKTTPIYKLIILQLQWLLPIYNIYDYTDELLKLLKIINGNPQIDFIISLPDILPSNIHSRLANELTDLLLTDTYLTSSILDSLSHLEIDDDTMNNILDKILDILNCLDLQILPKYLQFLFKSLTLRNVEFSKVYDSLRKNIDIVKIQSNENDLVLILDSLKTCLKYHPSICTQIISFINKSDTFNSFDFWCLLFCYNSTSNSSCNTIISIFLKKWHEECIYFLDSNIKSLYTIIEDIFFNYMHFTEHILRKNTPVSLEIGFKILYPAVFGIIKNDYYKQEIILNLISLASSDVENLVHGSINALIKFADTNFCSNLKKYSVFLFSLFDSLPNYSIQNAYLLLDLFSSLSINFADDGMSVDNNLLNSLHSISIDNEFFIQNRKLLSTGKFNLERLGVIGTVSLLCKLSIILQNNEISTALKSSTSKIFNELYLLLQSSSKKSRVVLAYVADEFSNCINNKSLDLIILVNFTNIYVWITECLGDFILDDSVSVSAPHAINYRPNSFNSDFDNELSISPNFCNPHKLEFMVSLPSLLRLEGIVRCPEVAHISNFSLILFDSSFDELIENSRQETQLFYVSSLLSGVNVLREIIGSFKENDPEFPLVRASLRLKHLLEITKTLRSGIEKLSNAVLEPIGTISRPSVCLQPNIEPLPKKLTNQLKWIHICKFIRNLQLPSYSLLSLPLEENLHSILFLVENLHSYITQDDITKKTRKFDNEFFAIKFFSSLIPVFKAFRLNLNEILDQLSIKYSRSSDDYNDTDADAEISALKKLNSLSDYFPVSKKFMLLKIILLIFDLLKVILSIDHLVENGTLKVVIAHVLQELAGIETPPYAPEIEESCSFNEGCRRMFDRSEQVLMWMLKFHDSVSILHVMEKLVLLPHLVDSAVYYSRLAISAGTILSKLWYKNELKSQSMCYVIKLSLSYSDNPALILRKIVADGLPSVLNESQLNEDDMFYNTLSKDTFSDYFKSAFEDLNRQLSVNLKLEGPENLVLESLNDSADLFEKIVQIAKTTGDIDLPVLSSAVKYSRNYLDILVKHLSPMEVFFNQSKNDMIGYLKPIQKATRMLNIICNHGKTIKDNSISVNTPMLKRAIENFVCSIRKVYSENNMLDSLTIGTLKPKKIDDTVLLEVESDSEDLSYTQITKVDKVKNVPLQLPSKKKLVVSDDDLCDAESGNSDFDTTSEVVKSKTTKISNKRKKKAEAEDQTDKEEAEDLAGFFASEDEQESSDETLNKSEKKKSKKSKKKSKRHLLKKSKSDNEETPIPKSEDEKELTDSD